MMKAVGQLENLADPFCYQSFPCFSRRSPQPLIQSRRCRNPAISHLICELCMEFEVRQIGCIEFSQVEWKIWIRVLGIKRVCTQLCSSVQYLYPNNDCLGE